MEEAKKRFEGFQFYDSPIKRTSSKFDEVSIEVFQFYDSPIKSALTGEVLGKGSGVSIL